MMDIKDVNNGLLNLLQANRANLQGTAVNTTGFGDLLAGLESEKTPSVEVKADFREAKNAASSNLSKPRAEDKSVAGREQKTENKSASDRREDKVKEQPESEKAEKPQNEKTDNSSAEKPEKAENGGNERSSAEKTTERKPPVMFPVLNGLTKLLPRKMLRPYRTKRRRKAVWPRERKFRWMLWL